MNQFRLVILVAILSAVPVSVRAVHELKAARSVDEYRQVGDRRVWSFFARGSTFGQLVSTVTGRTRVDGHQGVVISQVLALDYTSIGAARNLLNIGEQWVTSEGYYLGGKMVFETDGRSDELELKRQGEDIAGYYTRSGRKVPQTIKVDRQMFAWDNHYVDQLELLLAMRDIRVGDEIADSIFLPQPMIKTRIAGTVSDYSYQEIYRNNFDTVFTIYLSQPMTATLFYTSDKRLVKVDLPDYDFRIYQDLVESVKTKPTEAISPPFSFVRLIAIFPHYAAYLLFSVISLIFFMGGGYRWVESYLGCLIGGLLFLVTIVTLVPMQELIIQQWLIPSMSAGESLYYVGIFPALVSGVIQELLKLAAILLLVFWRKPKKYRYAVLGAFCGAGFALFEACHVAGFTIAPLFRWGLLERGALILYHVSSGALLGRVISRGTDRTVAALLVLILMNAAFRYLPVFVHEDMVGMHMICLLCSLMAMGFLVFTLLYIRKGLWRRET